LVLLRRVRSRGERLRRTLTARGKRPRFPGLFPLLAGIMLAVVACGADPELQPDEVLRVELGMTDRDEIHRVLVTGGEIERSEPAEATVPPGAFVEFVTGDWLIHEVIFELDSLGTAARAFLERTDQTSSPPLIQRDSRFVVSFEDAPEGRYPYRLEGNGRPSRGAVVVSDDSSG